MITGIVATDIDNHHLIELSQTMLSPMTNSFWFVRGICEGTSVLSDYITWKKLSKMEEIPASVPVFINMDPALIKRKFPLTSLTMIGNQLVESHMQDVDRLLHIRYREVMLPSQMNDDRTFPFPDLPKNTLAMMPYFDIFEYVINEPSYEIELH
jgi:hypothetical protein